MILVSTSQYVASREGATYVTARLETERVQGMDEVQVTIVSKMSSKKHGVREYRRVLGRTGRASLRHFATELLKALEL